MKSINYTNHLNRQRFKSLELKKCLLKSISHDQNISPKIRWIAQIQSDKLNSAGSIVKTTNRCVLTSQARSVDSKLKISRIKLRFLFLNAKVPGVQKAIW